MMTKKEFMQYEASKISELLSESLEEDISAEVVSVVKVNDRRLNSLRITIGESDMSPTVYLDNVYNAYLEGEDPDVLASAISSEILLADRHIPALKTADNQLNFSDKPISLKVLDSKYNKEFLKDTPYMAVGNGLVLICDIRINKNETGFFTTVVNNELLNILGRDKIDVFRQAVNEAWDIDKPVFADMNSKLFDSTPVNLLEEEQTIAEPEKMYILSNSSGTHGAAALFYPDVQHRISEVLGENYYALPSSTEEFIIVPESAGIEPKEFTEVVCNANKAVVDPGLFLSDSVFKYDKDTGTLHDVTVSRSLTNRESEMRC